MLATRTWYAVCTAPRPGDVECHERLGASPGMPIGSTRPLASSPVTVSGVAAAAALVGSSAVAAVGAMAPEPRVRASAPTRTRARWARGDIGAPFGAGGGERSTGRHLRTTSFVRARAACFEPR